MININGKNWRILVVSSNHPMLVRPDGSFTLGCCETSLKTIYIVEGLTDFYFKKVLAKASLFYYNVFCCWSGAVVAQLIRNQ